MWGWRKYVPVGDRIANGRKKVKKRLKNGVIPDPVEIEGRIIAREFWGIQWCDQMESFSDYESRLQRGRSYARNGSICHLSIEEGVVEAYVTGSDLYSVSIRISPISSDKWQRIVHQAKGRVGSLLELLKGSVSKEIMKIVIDPEKGLLPQADEIKYSCDCPDWAYMCKHVAAVLYGIGNRLDMRPDLLFILRGVDPKELLSTEWMEEEQRSENVIELEGLSGLFDIELVEDNDVVLPKPEQKAKVVKTPQTMDVQIEITGLQLLELRTLLGMGIEDFAEELGLSVEAVQDWERTSEVVSLDGCAIGAVIKLFKKLGVME